MTHSKGSSSEPVSAEKLDGAKCLKTCPRSRCHEVGHCLAAEAAVRTALPETEETPAPTQSVYNDLTSYDTWVNPTAAPLTGDTPMSDARWGEVYDQGGNTITWFDAAELMCKFARDFERELAGANALGMIRIRELEHELAEALKKKEEVVGKWMDRAHTAERELTAERDRRVNAELDRDAHKARLAVVHSASGNNNGLAGRPTAQPGSGEDCGPAKEGSIPSGSALSTKPLITPGLINDSVSATGLAHTDHPLRHFDRTCPACIAENAVSTTGLREALEDQRDAWIDTRDNPAADEWIKGFAQQQIDAAIVALSATGLPK
jgi:hypothetical protein